MIKLIADSGSTKTDWALLNDSETPYLFQTKGTNPYFMDSGDIASLLADELPETLDNGRVEVIHFYGAGCSTQQRCRNVSDGLALVFPHAVIYVAHDLLAAARALCGKAAGIAAILGTGSNSCYYDGNEIKESRGGIGFILGDEGSGAHIGKKLVQAYLYRELPVDVENAFEKRFHYTKDQMIEAIYRKPHPNRFLAEFAPFIEDHIHHAFVREIVFSSFNEFFIRHIIRFEKCREVPVHFVGSIGYHFSDILREVAAKHQVQFGKLTTKPISQLIEFHSE